MDEGTTPGTYDPGASWLLELVLEKYEQGYPQQRSPASTSREPSWESLDNDKLGISWLWPAEAKAGRSTRLFSDHSVDTVFQEIALIYY